MVQPIFDRKALRTRPVQDVSAPSKWLLAVIAFCAGWTAGLWLPVVKASSHKPPMVGVSKYATPATAVKKKPEPEPWEAEAKRIGEEEEEKKRIQAPVFDPENDRTKIVEP